MQLPIYIPVVIALLYPKSTFADGNGLIGWGKTMYDPTCAFACRGVIAKCTLLCTPAGGSANHGTHHNPVATPPECFTTDNAFMRTMALCIHNYCPGNGSPALSKIEDYWYSHLGTGSIGNYKYVPTISYTEALLAAKQDEINGVTFADATNSTGSEHVGHQMFRRVPEGESATATASSTLPTIKAKQPLNVTSLITAKDWQLQFNGMRNFEINENGHSTYSITLMFIALFIPILLSLLRYIPGLARSKPWSYLNSVLNYPALWGKAHRSPVAMINGGGLSPTRGQALYITLLSFLNIIFLAAPYTFIQPQSIFGTRREQEYSVIGCRAGALALGNMVAMFVFSARNNLLLYLTNWSHNTFLLLHRWLGYWTIIHTVLHSILLLAYYKKYGDYASELFRLYWIWGIIGTVAAVAILPASLLVVRQKAYELFLLSHIILVIIFLVGYYYHIWYVFEYRWGYEIWAFIAIGIWGADRIWRFASMFFHGWRTAKVTPVAGSDGEYLRIDIEGVCIDGVAYLCFPTLGWNFWQCHPFSVASSFVRHGIIQQDTTIEPIGDETRKDEDEIVISAKNPSDEDSGSSTQYMDTLPQAGFIARVRNGITSKLATRLDSSSELSLPVLIEGPYRSNADSKISECATIICIAGGVGITALLPYLRTFHAPRQGRLFWGMRKASLMDSLTVEIADLPKGVHVETTVGERLNVKKILLEELGSHSGNGLTGVVVCGPPGLADEVRYQITSLTRQGTLRTPFILIDEAFSW
ncbi:hypothetical protein H072_11570 [Dactylellina haptotyla CBS 200.50]|uniref:Ferric oxidoreductase domain-containing protein n=1 Tax=Dactylellina haptotyla (strain CBS 200.50) TaxID=1284197 RepID=S8BIP8_DACHA|nr:hypothetical protein H072_11570 [Dactylellina haptotyla CBS 200.50]